MFLRVHQFPKILHKKLKAEIAKCDMIGYFKDNSQSYCAITASVFIFWCKILHIRECYAVHVHVQ